MEKRGRKIMSNIVGLIFGEWGAAKLSIFKRNSCGLKFNFLETFRPFVIDLFIHVSLWPEQALLRLSGLYLPFDKRK